MKKKCCVRCELSVHPGVLSRIDGQMICLNCETEILFEAFAAISEKNPDYSADILNDLRERFA